MFLTNVLGRHFFPQGKPTFPSKVSIIQANDVVDVMLIPFVMVAEEESERIPESPLKR